jgi:hypothetical protein
MTQITGRDSYLYGKALVLAISAIQRLPIEKRAVSDMIDMCAIARTYDVPMMVSFAGGAYFATGVPVNLFPEGSEDRYEIDEDWQTAFEEMLRDFIAKVEPHVDGD